MKTIAIVQARMGSTRLPGKSMMPLAGEPAIAHVVRRAAMVDGIAGTLVATTVSESDDELADFCESTGVEVFRGSEADVLDRYFRAATRAGADAVMRVTGDCPLLDPVQSALVLERFAADAADYASNASPPTLPDGLDTEVISMEVLETCWREATRKPQREHVTLFIHDNADRFKRVNVDYPRDLSGHRWTLDEEADYRFLSAVFDELARRRQFGHLSEVLAILEDRPEFAGINAGIGRNEGLVKSLREESRDGQDIQD